MYDTIIIGAGISGLAAAWQLRNRNILVLEKEPVPGGRIKTCTSHGISYDLGAVFGFSAASVPFPFKSEMIAEPDPLGLWYQGSLYSGTGVITCIAGVNSGLRLEARLVLLKLMDGGLPDYDTISPECLRILNAFFQVIHPGEMRDYILSRHIDAFCKHDSAHFVGGNKVVIDAFCGELASTPCQIRLNTAVTAIKQEDDAVQVTCLHNEIPSVYYAKTVIVTAPTPVVLKIIHQADEPSRTFLESLRYGSGIVVALGLKNVITPAFSYLVTPDLTTNTILRQQTQSPDVKVLILYYTGDKAEKLQSKNDQTIIDDAITALRIIGVSLDRADSLIFSDIHRWEHLGPVITQELYGAWNNDAARPMSRVFLGGEYTHVDPQNPLPYGMMPAAASGTTQAQAVQQFLAEEEAAAVRFVPEFLTDVFIYQLTDNRPIFRKRTEEGTIAFYGLILQATQDMKLCRYLLDCSVDGLWEYQQGFGVTAEDSALVLEGLWSVDLPATTLLPHLRKLIEAFYNAEQGAFHTVLQGRAAYWHGPSGDATSLAGHLLQCIAPDEFTDIIASCRSYLLQTQGVEGAWRSKWFPETLVPTWYAVRLLISDYQANKEAIDRAVNYTLNRQSPKGCWNNSIIDTSAALLLLKTVNRLQPENEKTDTTLFTRIEKASTWLISEQATDGRRGEPLLYYWFEEQSPCPDLIPGLRLFYHCSDKGKISAAWAKLALAEPV
ncbi:MAG: FAD-dependent oxidoreductase [Desulfuromonadaceae bacterium]|nr:FAD-dependent oxidoreductase [Desulfuromonadaceae bacterium]